MFFPPIKESVYRVIFYAIIRERDVTISRIRQDQKSAKFYGEHFLYYNFFCKFGSFRAIGLNVKFLLTSLLEMSAILKV